MGDRKYEENFLSNYFEKHKRNVIAFRRVTLYEMANELLLVLLMELLHERAH